MNSRIQATTNTQNKLIPPRELYDDYGAMLLGYIVGVVNDRHVAGQYLVEIFKDLSNGLSVNQEKGSSVFVQLQLLARKKLEPFFETAKNCSTTDFVYDAQSKNRSIGLMTPDQQTVFCGMHYHGKSVNILALELNKSGDEIRKILKESFTIIRNSNGR